jgi:di/tricarboxylate transporter
MAIVTSLCQTLGASPTKNRKSNGGEYLVLVASHANLIAAATYQTGNNSPAWQAVGPTKGTDLWPDRICLAGQLRYGCRRLGMAANPIVSQKALDIFGIDYGFGRWLLSALVPSLVAAAVLPWSMWLVSRPTVDVSAVRAVISSELRTYGWHPIWKSGGRSNSHGGGWNANLRPSGGQFPAWAAPLGGSGPWWPSSHRA